MKLCRLAVLLILSAGAYLTGQAQPRAVQTPTPSPTPSPQSKRTPSFWATLADFFGISSNPDKQKGPDNVMIQGQIWARDLQSIGSIANQVTSDSGGYRSPIFLSGGRYLLALKGEMVVKVRVSNGSVETLFPIKGIEKLVGLRKTADEQAGDQVLVLIGQGGDSCPIIGILSVKNKDVTPIPYVPYTGGDDDMLLIDHLRGWTREYDGGNFLLQVQDLVNCTGPDKAPTTNICFQEKGKPWRQVTDCSPANCGQPSLSNDRTKMVYIKDG